MKEQALPGLEEPDVTVDCPEGCGEKITGRARGAGSWSWKLGLHLKNKHGIAGKKSRAKQGDVADEELAGAEGGAVQAVVSSVRQMAADVGTRGGTPNADELARGLGRGLSLASIFAASWMVDTDPYIPATEEGMRAREQLIDALSMTPKAGSTTMHPIGKAFAPTRLNQRFGRTIVDNVDVIGSLSEIGLLVLHWKQYISTRRAAAWEEPEQQALPTPTRPVHIPAPPDAGPGGRDDAQWIHGPNRNGHTPAPTEGRVLGPDDVARIRAQQQRG